jgi:hypothetical protein
MKKSLYILLAICVTVLVQSCGNILGTDDDVNVTPIVPIVKDSLLKIGEQDWDIVEIAVDNEAESYIQYPWYDNYDNKSIIYLDTASESKELHFHVKLETTIEYKFTRQRADRIILVEYNMDNFVPTLSRPDLEKDGSGAEILIIIEKANGEKIVLDEMDVVSYVEVLVNGESKTISGKLKFAPYLDFGFETRQIICNFEFRY